MTNLEQRSENKGPDAPVRLGTARPLPKNFRVCPNCGYIGEPQNCSCMWMLRRVAEGKGLDRDVVKGAQTLLNIVRRRGA